MGGIYRRMVYLSERGYETKLHLILVTAVVTAAVCSRLDVPIRGRVFVRWAYYYTERVRMSWI
jgi:hypothetical protein